MADILLTTAATSTTRLPQWSLSKHIRMPKRVWCTIKDAAVIGDASSSTSSSSSGRCFGEVYVASVPLRAPAGAAQVFDFMKNFAVFANFQHYITIIKPYEEAPCTVLDFQPMNPEDPMTAVAVLMGQNIPGVIQERTLSRLPNQRCWLIGPMKPELSLEDAVTFSRNYNSELSLGINDCRHHTLDLVEYLTGESMNLIEEARREVEVDPSSMDESSDMGSVETELNN